MSPGGIRTRSPSKRAAVDPRFRPHGHWDRLNLSMSNARIFPEEPDTVENRCDCQNILVITTMCRVNTVTGPCAKLLKETVLPNERVTAYKEGRE